MLEARKKVRVLAEDLGLGSVTATALCVVTSEIFRAAIRVSSDAAARLRVDDAPGSPRLVVSIDAASEAPDFKSLKSDFGIDGTIGRGPTGSSTVELSVPLASAELDLDETFIDVERERLIQRSAGQLISEVKRQNRELTELLEELRATKNDLARKARDLESVNRELEAFSYSVSHDLRAPLRAIDGFSQAVLEDYEQLLDEEGKGHLRRIRAASIRMAELIDDLLGLSRLTRGEMTLGPVDLSAIAMEVAEELGEKEPDRDVEFVIAPGMTVVADPTLMQVVLANLLGNAFKFTGWVEHAHIEFGRERSDGDWYFVRDNGAGFDMAYADKLFGAFQRLHTSEEFDGTGIGLATVQRAVHRHGGEVRAEGAVGKGATIYFTLGDGEGGDTHAR